MDAKLIAAIQNMNAIVQCKVIAYAVQIANAQLAFVQKLSDKCSLMVTVYFLFFDRLLS